MKYKVGTELQLLNETSWSLKSHTLIVLRYDGIYVWCKRKGGSESEYCYRIDEVAKLTTNPFVRIKRFFCRAFEKCFSK